ncbi:MAG: energy transducer TonB [Ferruginibacter sp.]
MNTIKIFITIAFLLTAFYLSAQVNGKKDSAKLSSSEFMAVEVEAFYPGGGEAWQKFLEKNLNSSIPVKNMAPVGKYVATVLFVVDKDGTLSNIKAETHFGYGMEDEVIRVVERSGKWTAATRNGQPLKALRRQPVTFLIDDENFKITTSEPYTLFVNADNEISVSARKIKTADLSINVQGGKSVRLSDGVFNVRVSKPGRVTIEIVNNKKDDKEIGVASFEVKAN